MKRVGRARATTEALRVAAAGRVSGACWQANFEAYVFKHYGEMVEAGITTRPQPTPMWKLPGRAWRILRQRGIGGLWREVLSYTRWLLIRVA